MRVAVALRNSWEKAKLSAVMPSLEQDPYAPGGHLYHQAPAEGVEKDQVEEVEPKLQGDARQQLLNDGFFGFVSDFLVFLFLNVRLKSKQVS